MSFPSAMSPLPVSTGQAYPSLKRENAGGWRRISDWPSPTDVQPRHCPDELDAFVATKLATFSRVVFESPMDCRCVR